MRVRWYGGYGFSSCTAPLIRPCGAPSPLWGEGLLERMGPFSCGILVCPDPSKAQKSPPFGGLFSWLWRSYFTPSLNIRMAVSLSPEMMSMM